MFKRQHFNLKIMGLGLILCSTVALSTTPAHAQLSVCYLGMQNSISSAHIDESNMHPALYLDDGYRFYDASEMSCQDVHRIEAGIATVVFSLSIGEGVATATGVGVPVTVGLAISAAGLSYANFWISGVNCDQDPVKVQNQIKDSICNVFADSPNVSCNPESVQVLTAGSSVMCHE